MIHSDVATSFAASICGVDAVNGLVIGYVCQYDVANNILACIMFSVIEYTCWHMLNGIYGWHVATRYQVMEYA